MIVNLLRIYLLLGGLMKISNGDRLQCPFLSKNIDDSCSTNENQLPEFTCAKPPQHCSKSKYRSFNGSCNNLKHPGWGMANTRYDRFLKPNYGDGVSTPVLAVGGGPLPSARVISNNCFREAKSADPTYTLLNMQWGQEIAHDMSLLAGSTISIRKLTHCCTPDGKMLNATDLSKFCFPIAVPKDDAYGSKLGIECENFVRTLTDRDLKCDKTDCQDYVEQVSIVTPFIDLSNVYGCTSELSFSLRSLENGHLRSDHRNDQELLPSTLDKYDVCNIANCDEACYSSGDCRINQNPGLVILSTILMREHNRLADGLSVINPWWTDEKLFQEARRINIAEFQAITYYEWMPILIGKENLTRFGVIYDNTDGGYTNDYDDSVNPAVFNEHASAGFRYFHTQIEGNLNLMISDTLNKSSFRLSDYYFKPDIVEETGNFDYLLNGLAFQAQQLTDVNYDPEIRDMWFRLNRPLGDDLKAIDIQRGRDHGLRSYNDYRVWSGKPRATKWEDFSDSVSTSVIDIWKQNYASLDDVEINLGSNSEFHEPNSLAGNLLNSFMIKQFLRTRVADRFFFEHGNDTETRFTKEQLAEIRKSSAARMLCNNGNNLKKIQSRCFELVSDSNPLVDCSSLPNIDLSVWKESDIVSDLLSVIKA